MDADPANNPASWQWTAGSGADAAPYFRIFNPITQGEKFDETGDYVRRFCPELKDVPIKYLFAPWEADGDTLARLRQDVIGEGVCFDGPFGTRRLVYADYTASGRALGCVERFIAESVLPFYANSHTEASFCGSAMTRLRAEARATIARLLNAGPDASVIFAGSGATAGVTRLVS